MTNHFTLAIIHPAFEQLKQSARFLHLVAGCLILFNALQFWFSHQTQLEVFVPQLILAVDVLLLVFFGGQLIRELPRINLIFRLLEVLTIFAISVNLLLDGAGWSALGHALLAFGFAVVLFREYRILHNESIRIQQTGISIPNLNKDVEMGWYELSRVVPQYHSILIETLKHKTIRFRLRRNLKIEELQQIDEFCRQHLPAAH